MWESVCRLKQGVNPAVRCVVCTYVVCWLVQLVVQERTHTHAQTEGHTEVGSGEEGQRKTERVRARGQEWAQWAPNIKTSLLCLCPPPQRTLETDFSCTNHAISVKSARPPPCFPIRSIGWLSFPFDPAQYLVRRIMRVQHTYLIARQACICTLNKLRQPRFRASGALQLEKAL